MIVQIGGNGDAQRALKVTPPPPKMQKSGLALELGGERDVKLLWKDVFLYALSYFNWGKQKKCNTGVKKGKKMYF